MWKNRNNSTNNIVIQKVVLHPNKMVITNQSENDKTAQQENWSN